MNAGKNDKIKTNQILKIILEKNVSARINFGAKWVALMVSTALIGI